MKYIVLSHRIGDVIQEIPIIFPENLVHSIVADAMNAALSHHGFKKVVCDRAGDCIVTECVTGGRSSTLGLEGDKEDHTLIELNDVLHGIIS